VLQAASIPVWKDTENLWPGEDWRQKIREAVEDGSLAFIACFSTNSVQKAKTYMNAELRLAVDQIRLMKPGQVRLLPVRFDDCDLPDFDLGNNRTLNSLQRIDLFGPNRDENLGRLISTVMKIFGTSTTTSASVVAAIAGSGNSERGPLPAEALKAGIGDPSRQMELEDLFLNEVRTTVQALKGDARFPA
jgi:TIR domain